MNPINPHDEVLLVVDQDQRFKDAQEQRKKIDPEREAETINTLVKVLGGRSIRFALVSDHDERGLKAYHRTGFEVVRVNGNRSGEVNRFIAQHAELLKNGRISHLVLVTADSTFAFLANQADRRTTQISVWAPSGKLSREMMATMPPCDFRDLDEMLPASPKVAVLIDFENIWYGLKKRGKIPEPRVLIDTIRNISGEFGEIKKLTAYADWEPMSQENHRNIQRELVQLDVDTQYLINIRGKNTADMRVANDIRDIVERGSSARDDMDVIVLATGDRDFRDIVKTAMDRGKRVVVLAVRNGVSQALIKVASDVRYIDELLKITKDAKQDKNAVRPWNGNMQNRPKAKPWIEYTLEVAKLIKYGKAWIPLNALPALGIRDVDEFVKEATKHQLVKLEKHIEKDLSEENGLRLNEENFNVKVVNRMTKWVPDRIAYYLTQRSMPYVDSAFIAKWMTWDQTFKKWGVGQHRREADKWLELLNKAGVIQKKARPHPANPDHLIDTWWLPDGSKMGENESITSKSSEPPADELHPSQDNQRKDQNSREKDQGDLWKTLIGAPV